VLQPGSDRDADLRRIADLEAQLAEREASVAAGDAAVAEREAEIPDPRGPVRAAHAARTIVLAVVAGGVALGAGVLAVRAPRSVAVASVSAPAPAAPRASVLADPAPAVGVGSEGVAPSQDEGQDSRPRYARQWSPRHEELPGEVALALQAGAALIASGRAGEAIPVLESARKEAPNSAQANHLLGRALLAEGARPAEAVRYLELATNIDGDRADYHLDLGRACEKLGDAQKALDHYRRYLELAPPSDARRGEVREALRRPGGRAP
jgi:tetratricopeptide (TPR) repeat protein